MKLTLPRVRGAWRLVLMLALAFLASFVTVWSLVNYQLPGYSFLLKSLQDSGHALAFFCLALVFCAVFRRVLTGWDKKMVALVAIATSVFIGALVEIIQSRVGRDPSWSDLLMDTIGASAGSALFLSLYAAGRAKKNLLWLVVVLLVISQASPSYWVYAGLRRDALFPVIADFDNHWLNKFIHTSHYTQFSLQLPPADWPGNISNVIKLDMQKAPWPGLQLDDIYGDWRNYHTLMFEVYNPEQESLDLVLRVHDKYHNNLHDDRFNRTFNIEPGYVQIQVSLDDIKNGPKLRTLEMGRISGVMVYLSYPDTFHSLYFDNFRLE